MYTVLVKYNVEMYVEHRAVPSGKLIGGRQEKNAWLITIELRSEIPREIPRKSAPFEINRDFFY